MSPPILPVLLRASVMFTLTLVYVFSSQESAPRQQVVEKGLGVDHVCRVNVFSSPQPRRRDMLTPHPSLPSTALLSYVLPFTPHLSLSLLSSDILSSSLRSSLVFIKTLICFIPMPSQPAKTLYVTPKGFNTFFCRSVYLFVFLCLPPTQTSWCLLLPPSLGLHLCQLDAHTVQTQDSLLPFRYRGNRFVCCSTCLSLRVL